MSTIEIILVSIIAIYSGFVLFISCKFLLKKKKLNTDLKPYSVIIVFRNEKNFIINCLEGVLKQNYLPKKIILVDDQSEDETLEIVNNFCKSLSNNSIQILQTKEGKIGKQEALFLGVEAAETELIITLDADCFVENQWSIFLLNQNEKKHRMISGPVLYTNQKGFVGNYMYSEFLYLMSAGVAAGVSSMPFQVSGANLLFYRDDFISFCKSDYASNYRHGDDVFFMQFLINKYGLSSVSFASCSQAIVKTYAPNTFKDMIQQRLRWMSKAKSYKHILPFIIGAMLFSVNLAFIVSMLYFLRIRIELFLILAVIKIIFDLLLPVIAVLKWRLKINVFIQIFLALTYPFYMFMLMFAPLFFSRKEWKGRQI